MAQDTIEVDGQAYVLSRQAAKMTGYAQDYIGQLARSGAVMAQRVGGLWYVNMDALAAHKKDAEAYVPEPPATHMPEGGDSIVSFDGKEYISSKRAASMTSYAQDYIGQLARSGKIKSRQVGGRWYVSKDDLLGHKREKDALLAAVQAESVGLERRTTPTRSIAATAPAAPLLTYHAEPAVDLPPLPEKRVFSPINTVSRYEISDSRGTIPNVNAVQNPHQDDSDNENAIHHIAIRSMQRDTMRTHATPARHATASGASSDAYTSYRGHWSTPVSPKRKRSAFPLLILIAIICLVVGFGAYAVFLDAIPMDTGNISRTIISNVHIGSFVDQISSMLGGNETYHRQ